MFGIREYIIGIMIIAIIALLWACNLKTNKIDSLSHVLAVQNAQFEALADSYKTSAQNYEKDKISIEAKYSKRIEEAKSLTHDQECGYMKNRVREYTK